VSRIGSEIIKTNFVLPVEMAIFIKDSTFKTRAWESVSTFAPLVIDMRDPGTTIKWKDMVFILKMMMEYYQGCGPKGL
jgi:hypothetical protein